jgi:hypothetical protein
MYCVEILKGEENESGLWDEIQQIEEKCYEVHFDLCN